MTHETITSNKFSEVKSQIDTAIKKAIDSHTASQAILVLGLISAKVTYLAFTNQITGAEALTLINKLNQEKEGLNHYLSD